MSINDYLLKDETVHIVNIVSSRYENFTLDDCISMVPSLIIYVEKFNELTGKNKRDLVVEILKLIIDKTDLPGDDELIDPLLKQFIPKVIDTLIEVDKRNIKLNKKRKCIWEILRKLRICKK